MPNMKSSSRSQLSESLKPNEITLNLATLPAPHFAHFERAFDHAVAAKAERAVDAWIGPRQATVEGVRASVDEIEASGSGWTFAKLTIANATIRDLATAAVNG